MRNDKHRYLEVRHVGGGEFPEVITMLLSRLTEHEDIVLYFMFVFDLLGVFDQHVPEHWLKPLKAGIANVSFLSAITLPHDQFKLMWVRGPHTTISYSLNYKF